MKARRLVGGLLLVGVVCACSGGGSAATAAGADAGGGPPLPPGAALGMNDVTILVPLPATETTPVVLRGSDAAADATPLVPRPLFDRLVAARSATEPALVPDDDYTRLQLVAVRFDLCDRG